MALTSGTEEKRRRLIDVSLAVCEREPLWRSMNALWRHFLTVTASRHLLLPYCRLCVCVAYGFECSSCERLGCWCLRYALQALAFHCSQPVRGENVKSMFTLSLSYRSEIHEVFA